jgi:hypothetical protein
MARRTASFECIIGQPEHKGRSSPQGAPYFFCGWIIGNGRKHVNADAGYADAGYAAAGQNPSAKIRLVTAGDF